MIVDGLTLTKDRTEEADVVIIGSGAGGAVLAAELAERGRTVVVLEAGQAHPPGEITGGPAEMTVRLYRFNGIVATLGRPGIALPYGQCLGGTTVINSGTCFRLPDTVLARWQREVGLDGITRELLAPIFDQLEDFLGVAPVDEKVMGRNAELFKKGAQALGYKHGVLRRNARACKGTGMCAFGCPTKAKQSMDVSFVPRAERAGARFYTSVRALDLIVEGGAARGVVGRLTDPTGEHLRPEKVTVRAKAVALAGGAIGTPYLLLRNKLCRRGPVGKHLSIHPAAKVFAEFDEEVRGWLGIPQSYHCDEFHDQGIIFENIFVGPEFTAMALPYFGRRHAEIMTKYPRLAAFGMMVSDTSRGFVLKGLGEYGVPYYFLNQADTLKFRKGLAEACRIFLAAGATRVYPNLPHCPELTTTAEIDQLERAPLKGTHIELMAFHPMGTCRMGTDPRTSVVDANLETHEVKRLYVTDASIFPTSLGVNPQMGIMAFATRAAAHIHETI
ncbi:MAG TPA: GMC family oxidoreductase [Polyangia bacterium]